MADVKTRYDVIIVGSGAGGATIANELAATGRKILILERGPDNWNSTYVFIDRRYRTTELWYDRQGRPCVHEPDADDRGERNARGRSSQGSPWRLMGELS
ncbi:MAG: NAD(P)-binding protein [Caulobacterales bacterium]